MRVLVVNAGSSSLKLRVVTSSDELSASHDLPPPDRKVEEQLREAVHSSGPIDAIGHRIVHGGTLFPHSVVIEGPVEEQLRSLAALAPLHQPSSLAALDAVKAVLPETPAVACFDTAFHATLPPAASTYAVPLEWRERLAVRRYGFHGLSHSYAAGRACELLDLPAEEARMVTCHLGAGASLAAVRAGRSVDTTMGFTPLEGLVMATRSGTVDPGLILWLQQSAGLTAADVLDALERHSGLSALGGTPDLEAVLAAAQAGGEEARLAVDVYLHRLRGGIAAMTAALGGLDALVFTGGVGENAPEIRARAAEGLGWLGIAVDGERNRAARRDADISGADSSVRTAVVTAREDLVIAREVRALLAGA